MLASELKYPWIKKKKKLRLTNQANFMLIYFVG